jgi:gliding motility-associated-like protein
LTLPYQNTDPTETIFVRIENNDNNNCFDTTSFNINVFDTPVPPVGIEYNQCDYTNPGDLTEVFDLSSFDTDIANGQDVSVLHHVSLEDAENGINPITDPYSNTSSSQTIYAVLINNTYADCTSIATYTITVDPLPNLITDVPLVQCDIDDVQDGISLYNLQQAAENIIVGDDPENYSLSFHLSQEDLEFNSNAIPDPTNFVNTSPLQTIFTRVENIATTCYSTSFFYLETIFNPIPGDAGLIACDNSEMNGNDYDGLGLFTLSDANDYILSLIVANPDNDITSTSQLDIVYYFSENDALSEVNPLPDQYLSEVPNLQTVFLRIERGNDCFGINTMTLQVVPVPELNEVPDEILCTDTPGIADVVLIDYNPIVLGSQAAADVIISYYATQEDADAGVNPLTSPYTVNNEQTIFVREEIQNNDPDVTACYITSVNFTLTVEQNPQINIPDPLFVCDDDFDGLQTFDLSGVDTNIIGTQTDMTVSYYTNQNDADSATNPIGTTFDTTIPNAQTLIFRIESLITGCYSTAALELIVNPIPIIPSLDDFVTCDDNIETDNDISNDSVEFDLQTQNILILDGLDPAIFEVSYHETQNDAQQGINPLPLSFTNTANPQTIFTRVENTITNCFNTAPLVLTINPLPFVSLEEDYLLCINTNGTEILDPLVIYSNLSATDFTFVWSNANGDVLGTTSNFEPTQGGVYALEVFDALLPTQCGSPVKTFTVVESSPPEATAEVTSEPFASTHVIQSTATGQGIYEFSLDDGPWGNSGLFVGVTPGEHSVSVRDLNGCGIQQIPLFVFDYPKFFTPNQDGYNDTWNITAFANQPNAKIYIFDRYGKLLKLISPASRGWDGTYNGAEMPSADYWFSFQYNDVTTGNIKEVIGHFSLKR